MSKNSHIDHTGDGDLGPTAERLRAARVEPTPLELDRALSTARKRVNLGARRPSNGGFMRSKIAIVSILALGLFTSGAGATLAFQGSSSSDNASSAEYPPPAPPDGDTDSLGEDAAGSSQDARQTSATGDDKLPFTGFAAIPVIVVGLGLVAVGGTLQRRTRREP
jgi:hypothetical protein